MNIAIIIDSLTFSGGGQRQALELAKNLQKTGNNVDIFCKNVDKKECYPSLIKELNIFSINTNFSINKIKGKSFFTKIINLIFGKFSNFINNIKLITLIKYHNKNKNYDIFNYHDGMYLIGKYFKKEKNVWMMNDTQGGLNKNILFSTNKSFLNHIMIYLGKINSIFVKLYISKIIVLDNLNKNIVDKYIKIKTFVVRSGLDKTKFNYDNISIDLKNKKVKFLCTSIFSRHRRYEDVINALSIIKNKGYNNFSLDIIGNIDEDINYYNEITQLVNINNLNLNINFLGKVSEEILIKKYNESDIFLYPNSPQTWGLAVFEAICSGCATIITKGCGAHEILTDNLNTIIIDDKSPNIICRKNTIINK